jgi:hypothetical protein
MLQNEYVIFQMIEQKTALMRALVSISPILLRKIKIHLSYHDFLKEPKFWDKKNV